MSTTDIGLPSMNANQLTGEILIALSQRYGHRCIAFRANVITARAARGAVRSLPAGTADVLAAVCGRPVAIEVKAGRDRLRPSQIAFRDAWIKAGGIHIEARGVDAAMAELEARITGGQA